MPHSPSPFNETENQKDVSTSEKTRIQRPKKYKVFLLNDDYTPMEFVIEILRRFFSKPSIDAEKIMLNVHHQGKGLAGIYTKELAETKITKVHKIARQNQFPLSCQMEADT